MREEVAMPKSRAIHKVTNAIVGALLAICLIVIMATALIEEAPHEYLGIALFALMVAHVVLNRRWFAALGRGRWSPGRVLQAVVIAALVVCMVGQVASAVVLSKHALGFLPAITGASWARGVHMVCSYWSFVLAFAHVGLQVKPMCAKLHLLRDAKPSALWVLRVLWLIVAAAGVFSFAQMGLGDYLIARVQFAAADHGSALVMRMAKFASVGVLVAGLFHYANVALGALRRTS